MLHEHGIHGHHFLLWQSSCQSSTIYLAYKSTSQKGTLLKASWLPQPQGWRNGHSISQHCVCQCMAVATSEDKEPPYV